NIQSIAATAADVAGTTVIQATPYLSGLTDALTRSRSQGGSTMPAPGQTGQEMFQSQSTCQGPDLLAVHLLIRTGAGVLIAPFLPGFITFCSLKPKGGGPPGHAFFSRIRSRLPRNTWCALIRPSSTERT